MQCHMPAWPLRVHVHVSGCCWLDYVPLLLATWLTAAKLPTCSIKVRCAVVQALHVLACKDEEPELCASMSGLAAARSSAPCRTSCTARARTMPTCGAWPWSSWRPARSGVPRGAALVACSSAAPDLTFPARSVRQSVRSTRQQAARDRGDIFQTRRSLVHFLCEGAGGQAWCAVSLTARRCGRYAEFVAGDYQSYLRDMARDGTWGDHLTLQARSCSPCSLELPQVTGG